MIKLTKQNSLNKVATIFPYESWGTVTSGGKTFSRQGNFVYSNCKSRLNSRRFFLQKSRIVKVSSSKDEKQNLAISIYSKQSSLVPSKEKWDQRPDLKRTEFLYGDKSIDLAILLKSPNLTVTIPEVWNENLEEAKSSSKNREVKLSTERRGSKISIKDRGFSKNKTKNNFQFTEKSCLKFLEKFNEVFLKKVSDAFNLSENKTFSGNKEEDLKSFKYLNGLLIPGTEELSKLNELLFDFENPQNHHRKIYFFSEAFKNLYIDLTVVYVELKIDSNEEILRSMLDEWKFFKKHISDRNFREFKRKHPAKKNLSNYQEFKLVLSNCVLFCCYLGTLRVANSISKIDTNTANFLKTESFRENELVEFWIIILEFAPTIESLFEPKNKKRVQIPTSKEYKNLKKLLKEIQKFCPEAFNEAFTIVVENDSEKNEIFSLKNVPDGNKMTYLIEHQRNIKKRQEFYKLQEPLGCHEKEVFSPDNLKLVFNLVSNSAFLTFSENKKLKIQKIKSFLKENKRLFKKIQGKLKSYKENKIALKRNELEFYQNTIPHLPEIIEELEKQKKDIEQFVKPKPTIANQKILNELFALYVLERKSWLILEHYITIAPEKIEEIYGSFQNLNILRKNKKTSINEYF